MSNVSKSQPANGTARPQKPKAPGKKEVKILMLHGEHPKSYCHCVVSCLSHDVLPSMSFNVH